MANAACPAGCGKSVQMFTIPFLLVHSSDMIVLYIQNQGFTQSSLSSLFLFFLQTKARSRRLRVFVCLFRVVEFKIVDADGVAVLDALLFQTVEQAAFAELAVEVHTGLVIVGSPGTDSYLKRE